MGAVARIVTTCQNGRGHATVERNREYMLGLLDRALLQKPDLVCFPETFTGVGVGADPSEVSEPVPGPTTDAFAKRAKEHGCYVICPIRTNRDGTERNTAIVIDRSGDILGMYDKAQPVTTSPDYTVFERGVMPGGEPAVFDLDFGRIGIQICFDAGFPESWAGLAAKGARAIFWPSAYDGGFTLQVYARLHHIYVITAVRSDRSRVIDPCGRIVASTDGLVNLAVRDVNLDFVVAHDDFNWPVMDRILDAYGDRVRITSYRDDGHFIVEPMDPDLTSAQLQDEFGFESTFQYHDRHRTAYAALHKGTAPTPQQAAHGDRAQYGK